MPNFYISVFLLTNFNKDLKTYETYIDWDKSPIRWSTIFKIYSQEYTLHEIIDIHISENF